MTRISTIHGIGADEYSDRGANVVSSGYFPYLSLTAGELRLMLARQRAKIFANFYPEVPQYRQAVVMLDNSLNAGISNGVNFVGALHDDYLQQVAKIIQSASKQTAPASRAGFARESILRGINAIPVADRYNECVTAARNAVRSRTQCKISPYAPGSFCDNLLQTELAKCQKAFKIESILNDGIEKSGHHMVYKDIPTEYATPTEVAIKRTLHKTGVEGMALVAKINNQLMYEWVENGILAKNAQAGVGPVSSAVTSFYLAPDPREAVDQFMAAYPKGVPSGNRKKDKIEGIGVDPLTGAVVVKIIGAISGALLAAAALLKALRSEEAYAMSEARGFGTQAFSGSQSDWLMPTATGGTGISPVLLLGGAAVLLLLSDNN